MSIGQTKMWRIKEHPGYTIEQTPGAWILWGPCIDHEYLPEDEFYHEDQFDCTHCGNSNEIIIDTCGIDSSGVPDNCHMIQDALGITDWTPVRIQ